MEEIKKINSDDIFKILGKNIKKVRVCKGLNQENLSNSLDKTLNFISLVENGKTGISVPTLVDICKTLDTNADTLFEGILNQNNEEDQRIFNMIRILNERDKKVLLDFINYIIDSKNK